MWLIGHPGMKAQVSTPQGIQLFQTLLKMQLLSALSNAAVRG